MVAQMKKGAVIVDVAIDQGGYVRKLAHPTSHVSNPSFVVDGVVHYCVTNMPGAVPHTSTLALTNSTFPYVLRIANLGVRDALNKDAGLAEGLNTWHGTLTYRGVAESQHKAVDGRRERDCPQGLTGALSTCKAILSEPIIAACPSWETRAGGPWPYWALACFCSSFSWAALRAPSELRMSSF